MDDPNTVNSESCIVNADNTRNEEGAPESQNVVIRLPTKLGNINISNTEELLQLLKSNVTVDSQDASGQGKEKTTKIQEVFKCSLCEYTSHNKHYLKQHVELVHLADRPFKCPFCDYAGKRSHSLKEHLIVHSSYRPYECHFCNATFRKKGHLTNHIKLHASESQEAEQHPCYLCSFFSASSSLLWQHMRDSHKDKVLLCDMCEYTTSNAGQLKVHSWSHKRGEKGQHYHQCTACDFVCEKELDIMVHISSSHHGKAGCTVRKNTQQDLVILLKCSECGFTTDDKLVLKEHMYTHVYPATSVGQNVEVPEQTVDSLGQGEVVPNSDVVYRCECGFMADSEALVLDHIQVDHSREKENSEVEVEPGTVVHLKCSECGFSTPSEDKMRTHMLIHLKTPASTNKKAARGHSTLSPTQQSQQGLHPNKAQTTVYNCGQCQFSSRDTVVFMTHMLTHNPKASVSATSQTFPSKAASVSSPQQVSTSVDAKKSAFSSQGYVHDTTAGVYRCTICSYVCDHQRTIKAHIWKHSGHKDIDYPMFQNGPLSMFDFTPIGVTSLASGRSIIAEPNPTPKSDSQTILTASNDLTRVKAGSINLPLPSENVPSTGTNLIDFPKVAQPSDITSGNETPVSSSYGAPALHNKTIVSAKAIQDGHNKQVILIPANKTELTVSAENPDLTPQESKGQPFMDRQQSAAVSLDTLMRNSGISPDINDLNSQEHTKDTTPVVTSFCVISSSTKRKHEIHEPVNQIKGGENAMGIKKPKPSPPGPASVVVEPMTVMYPAISVPTPSCQGSSVSSSPRAVDKAASINSEIGSEEEGEEEVGEKSSEVATEAVDSGIDGTEVAMEVNVCEDSMMDEVLHVEEAECVDVYTSQEEGLGTTDKEEDASTPEQPQQQHNDSTSDISHEEALSLLSLLKKGPNFNPACPPQQLTHSSDADMAQSLYNLPHSATKSVDSQSGISHSLLAAIEHLRQNSKSDDSDDEEEDEATVSTTVKNAKKKKNEITTRPASRRRGRKKTNPLDSPLAENHHNVEKISKNDLRCKLCHYITTSSLLMKAHLRTHKSKNPAECSLCDFESRDSEDLQKHILQHCKVRTYTCKFCPSEFSYKSQLRSHMRVHDHRQMLLCETCNFSTIDLAVYRKHLEKCRKTSTVCPKCSAKFPCQSELDEHLELKDCAEDDGTSDNSMKCDKCSFLTTSQDSYDKHLRWHGRIYTCDHCSFECSNYKGMSNHQRVHVEEKEQKCEFCDFVAKSVRSLKSHMKRHANDQRFVQQPLEQYVCNLCGYVCHHLPSLKCHMWRHSSDNNYSYEQINDIINAAIDYDSTAGTSSKSTVISEKELKHANNFITFRCCQCGFESLDKGALNAHMKLHMDIIRKTQEVNQGQFQIQHEETTQAAVEISPDVQ